MFEPKNSCGAYWSMPSPQYIRVSVATSRAEKVLTIPFDRLGAKVVVGGKVGGRVVVVSSSMYTSQKGV